VNPDGTPFVLEGGAEGYTSGRSLPDLPAALRPLRPVPEGARLALRALAAVTTCQEVLVNDPAS
jgi:hypothetical protein